MFGGGLTCMGMERYRDGHVTDAGGCPVLPYGYCLKASMTDLAVGCVVLFHPLLPVSGTRTGFDPLPSRERDSVGWFVLLYAPRCGYCLKASMTGLAVGLCCLVSPSPLIPLPSRERGFCRLFWTCSPASFATPLDCGSSPQ